MLKKSAEGYKPCCLHSLQQINQAGDKADPQLLQAQQAMEQLANQMEHMSSEIQDLREKKLIEVQRMEREWYDAQTNRMKADVEVMKANLDIRDRPQWMQADDYASPGARDMPEENAENEALEEMIMQAPHEQFAGGQPQATPARNAPAPKAPRTPKSWGNDKGAKHRSIGRRKETRRRT